MLHGLRTLKLCRSKDRQWFAKVEQRVEPLIRCVLSEKMCEEAFVEGKPADGERKLVEAIRCKFNEAPAAQGRARHEQPGIALTGKNLRKILQGETGSRTDLNQRKNQNDTSFGIRQTKLSPHLSKQREVETLSR